MNRRQGHKRASVSRQARRNALVRQGGHRVGNVKSSVERQHGQWPVLGSFGALAKMIGRSQRSGASRTGPSGQYSGSISEPAGGEKGAGGHFALGHFLDIIPFCHGAANGGQEKNQAGRPGVPRRAAKTCAGVKMFPVRRRPAVLSAWRRQHEDVRPFAVRLRFVAASADHRVPGWHGHPTRRHLAKPPYNVVLCEAGPML